MAPHGETMSFDAKRFMREKFIAREESVKVPDMKEWFDGEPVWTVRGLTGEELARANESVDQTRNIAAMVQAMTKDGKEKTQAFEELLGISDKAPADIIKRISMLVVASVEPKCDRQMAVRFADVYPVEFYNVTTTIVRLTGQGKIVGKPKPSGKIQASESPQASVEKEGDSSSK